MLLTIIIIILSIVMLITGFVLFITGPHVHNKLMAVLATLFVTLGSAGTICSIGIIISTLIY